MRRMIHQHLLQRTERIAPPTAQAALGPHLDEDALSAFVEGRLSEIESAPITSHLVSCNSCRRFTAQLIRLESEIGEREEAASPLPEAPEPGRIRSLLENLAARVLPVSDEVFAYHAPAEDFEPRSETKEDNDTDRTPDEQDDGSEPTH